MATKEFGITQAISEYLLPESHHPQSKNTNPGSPNQKERER
jgi:hypothetical protein